jgi:hypothetical protein
MNRRARRAAAAKARRNGYQHRLLTALNTLDVGLGQVGHIYVEHEDSCIYEAGRCTCRPEMTMRAGSRLQRIGLDGEVKETSLC